MRLPDERLMSLGRESTSWQLLRRGRHRARAGLELHAVYTSAARAAYTLAIRAATFLLVLAATGPAHQMPPFASGNCTGFATGHHRLEARLVLTVRA